MLYQKGDSFGKIKIYDHDIPTQGHEIWHEQNSVQQGNLGSMNMARLSAK